MARITESADRVVISRRQVHVFIGTAIQSVQRVHEGAALVVAFSPRSMRFPGQERTFPMCAVRAYSEGDAREGAYAIVLCDAPIITIDGAVDYNDGWWIVDGDDGRVHNIQHYDDTDVSYADVSAVEDDRTDSVAAEAEHDADDAIEEDGETDGEDVHDTGFGQELDDSDFETDSEEDGGLFYTGDDDEGENVAEDGEEDGEYEEAEAEEDYLPAPKGRAAARNAGRATGRAAGRQLPDYSDEFDEPRGNKKRGKAVEAPRRAGRNVAAQAPKGKVVVKGRVAQGKKPGVTKRVVTKATRNPPAKGRRGAVANGKKNKGRYSNF